MAKRWVKRPEGSNWGDFGEDDQLGRINLLTPEVVLKGIAEAKTGHRFCLSLPLDYPGGNKLNPRRHPPQKFSTQREGGIPNFNFPLSREDERLTDVICDDAVVLHTQYSTQWDSLAHVGEEFDADGDGVAEIVYYNGWRAHEDVVGPPSSETHEGSEARKLGIENMAQAAIQGRGVMIDLEKHHGHNRQLVGYDELMEVLDKDGVQVEPGDMVCFYTGFADVVLSMNKAPSHEKLENSCSVLNGRDPRLLNWITDNGVVAMIADNYAVESYPAEEGEGCCAALPLHEHCLFKLGIHLGELWYLTELAQWLRANNRSRFLLTAPPLRLPGAVGSPTTPVATV
ncbi:MAG: cyclase family protein [Rhodospirillales bacterium]|nr:cyclase family protein [Rhodospirillales bacterium]